MNQGHALPKLELHESLRFVSRWELGYMVILKVTAPSNFPLSKFEGDKSRNEKKSDINSSLV